MTNVKPQITVTKISRAVADVLGRIVKRVIIDYTIVRVIVVPGVAIEPPAGSCE